MVVVFNFSSSGWALVKFFLISAKRSRISPESVRGLEVEVGLKGCSSSRQGLWMCHMGLSRDIRDMRASEDWEPIEEIEDMEPAMFGLDSWCWMIS